MAGSEGVPYNTNTTFVSLTLFQLGPNMESNVKAVLRWGVFILAVAVTTGWLVLAFSYLTRFGWDGLMSLEPGDLAATLAAAAGPPVALWLVLMVASQKQELSALQKIVIDLGIALRRGQDQAETGSRALIEVTAASQRQAAQEGLLLALDDLTSNAAVVAERLGVLDPAGLDMAWARYGSGDRWAFLRPFVDRASEEDDFAARLAEALAGDASARLAADAYTRRLEHLRSGGSLKAEQKLITEILEDGPVARVGVLFSAQQAIEGTTAQPEPPDADGEGAETIEDRLGPQPTLFQPESKSA